MYLDVLIMYITNPRPSTLQLLGLKAKKTSKNRQITEKKAEKTAFFHKKLTKGSFYDPENVTSTRVFRHFRVRCVCQKMFKNSTFSSIVILQRHAWKSNLRRGNVPAVRPRGPDDALRTPTTCSIRFWPFSRSLCAREGGSAIGRYFSYVVLKPA